VSLTLARSMAEFSTTAWSVVLQAGQRDSPDAAPALAQLCEAYWQPLYGFLRRAGHAPAEAEDLTQLFITTRVATGLVLRDLDPTTGLFRSWLLKCLQNLVINECRRDRAQKRGGGAVELSLDLEAAERRYLDAGSSLGAEQLYDQQWARTVLERAYDKLQTTYRAAGKSALFERLKSALPGQDDTLPSYDELSLSLGKRVSTVRKAVQRLRDDYAAAIRAEIRATVSRDAEVDEELRYLLSLFDKRLLHPP